MCGAQKLTLGFCLYFSPPYCFETESLIEPRAPDWLDLEGHACSCLSSTEIIGTNGQDLMFTWVLKI